MTMQDKIYSNDYMDIIIKYNGNPKSLQPYDKYSVKIINDFAATLFLPISEVNDRLIMTYGYSAIPKCYSLTNEQSLEASGVNKLRRIPALNLNGKGVIVGIIDTGIDYTNPVFQNSDGTTKILSIWDQSIPSENQHPDIKWQPGYGTDYKADQINQALKSPTPLDIVPTVDEIGHGTMLAGIAAGSPNNKNNFSGVVPDANLVVVKLKQAKNNLRNYYSIPSDVPCYQENDIMWGLQYVIDIARSYNRPIAVCIGLGTSQGAHNDSGNLNTLVSLISRFPQVVISIAAGNEGNARRHFYSAIEASTGTIPMELVVGENEPGFTMELWGDPPLIYVTDILSPTGEYVPTLYGKLEETRVIRFIFDQTIIYIDYVLIESETGKQVIMFRFKNPTPGTWKFQVSAKGDLKGAFHSWLPSNHFISNQTYFVDSNPYTTLTSPGNNTVPICITAYNTNSGSLYMNSGKGFSTSHTINPDLTAPGVNISCPGPNNTFTTLTGTSAATAHTTGIAAMILEWGIIKNNFPDLNTVGVKKLLIRGANRNNQILYPNRDWGYGIIDIYNSYNTFRTDAL